MSMVSRINLARLAGGLVLVAAFALATHGLIARDSPDSPAKAPRAKQRADDDPLSGSAIAAVIEANDGKVPASGAQFHQAIAKLGDFDQMVIPFSAVALESGLSNPRIILTPRTSSISQAAVDRPNLEGRLFVAINLEKLVDADPMVTSIEFISWNSRRRQYDFGVIQGLGSQPQIQVVDGIRCFSCHKNRAPILGASPWSNTTHNPIVRRTTEQVLFPSGKNRSAATDRIDGVAILSSQAPQVDAAVRQGANLLRDRETFRLMNREPDGRNAFVVLLCGIAAPGEIEKVDREIQRTVNNTFTKSFSRFAADWVKLQRESKSSVLNDFSPAGSVGTASGWSGNTNNVLKYDIARLEGKAGLTSAALPSNPKAFAKPPVKVPGQPSSVVSAALLARTIGLTAGDRKFLAETLTEASKRAGKPEVTAATLARDVFEGVSFEDVRNDGELPDREDFKDRFVAGLDTVLKTRHGLTEGLAIPRTEYASGPAFTAARAKDLKEHKLAPTTACLACHEVRAVGKSRFVEPLPALAFDPFDKQGREAWLNTADRKRQQLILGRMLKRMAEDKDMPPVDSPEYELFRVNDATSFDEAKKFLESALKKAKGN